ncbi:MAG: alpha/beta fold hydrolase [Luteolibacter sp.]|nr:alpha/beta fold hydrolase [Luteolibacter sp.]
MVLRFFLMVLASLPLAAGEQPRIVLDDAAGERARAAHELLGDGGGNHLFYLPTHDQPATPASWGFKFENITFNSADGTPLHGWFIPARGEKPLGTVVFSHGNAGSIGHHLGFVMWLVEAGYHVMMYDYRGFGKSGGTVDRRGMVDDVKAAFAHVRGRAGVDSGRLVSYGHSLGGAKSVTALGEGPVRGLRAVIIDGAFASYQAMARIIGGQLGASLVTDELSPRDFVGKLSSVPLLVVHGSRDEVVPVAQGRELYDSARQPKTLFEVKTGRHGDSLSRDDGAFRKRMLVWLAGTMDG